MLKYICPLFISALQHGWCSVWDLETGNEKVKLEGHSSTVTSVAISPDGKTIVSGSGDKTIR